MKRLLGFALALALCATGAWADDIADCNQIKNVDLRISGCSKLINSKRLNKKDTANAYGNRGTAYGKKGEFDRAIADFGRAIKLNPKDADAYNNRGLAYENKGDREQVIVNYRKALEIDPSHQAAKNNLKRLGVTP